MSIIGGELFFINQNYKYVDNSLFDFLNNFNTNLYLYSSGRDALYSIFNHIKDKKYGYLIFCANLFLNQ